MEELSNTSDKHRLEYEFSLRDQILQTTHEWSVILLFCLSGIGIAWFFSLSYPPRYRAAKEIYVAINPYQALADRNAAEIAGVVFNNPDDYKHWQMENLNILVRTDWMMDLTLDELRQQDEFWNGINRDALAEILKVYWRNAGKWRLTAETRVPLRASQAVSAWEKTILQQIPQAVSASQQMMFLDSRIQAMAQEIARERAGSEQSQPGGQITSLEQILSDLESEYVNTTARSFGLSPNIQVEQISSRTPDAYPVRPTPLFLMAGGLLGLLGWFFYWMFRITGLSR
jgi:hypothetical protein